MYLLAELLPSSQEGFCSTEMFWYFPLSKMKVLVLLRCRRTNFLFG